MSAILYVKWNGKRFPVEFTGTKELQDTTVRELKATCHHITGIDPKFMKINAFGAYMTQDDLPLSAYGLRSGCFITLKTMRQKQHEHTRTKDSQTTEDKPLETTSAEEQNMLVQLQTIRSNLDTKIAAEVQKYEKSVKEYLAQSTRTNKEKKKLVYTGAYLNEQLMHALFDLDSVICGPDNVEARASRKDNVKRAQALLDKLDETKTIVKDTSIIDADEA